jgi:hypothetical protein
MKAELTKTIEARKLNKRTMRPLDNQWSTIPYGAPIENIERDGDEAQFQYLGEPYECAHEILMSAIGRKEPG